MSVNEMKTVRSVLELANEYERERALREKMDMPENVNTLNETEEQRNLTEKEAAESIEKEVNALTETEQEEPRNMTNYTANWGDLDSSFNGDTSWNEGIGKDCGKWEMAQDRLRTVGVAANQEFAGNETYEGEMSLSACQAKCQSGCIGVDWKYYSPKYCYTVSSSQAEANGTDDYYVKDSPTANKYIAFHRKKTGTNYNKVGVVVSCT
jgi:hypothetical protein